MQLCIDGINQEAIKITELLTCILWLCHKGFLLCFINSFDSITTYLKHNFHSFLTSYLLDFLHHLFSNRSRVRQYNIVNTIRNSIDMLCLCKRNSLTVVKPCHHNLMIACLVSTDTSKVILIEFRVLTFYTWLVYFYRFNICIAA